MSAGDEPASAADVGWLALFGPLLLGLLAATAYGISAHRPHSGILPELSLYVLLPTLLLQALLLVPFGLRWQKPVAGTRFKLAAIAAYTLVALALATTVLSTPTEVRRLFGAF